MENNFYLIPEKKSFFGNLKSNKGILLAFGFGFLLGVLVIGTILTLVGVKYLTIKIPNTNGQIINIPISEGIKANLSNDAFMACKLDPSLPVCKESK